MAEFDEQGKRFGSSFDGSGLDATGPVGDALLGDERQQEVEALVERRV